MHWNYRVIRHNDRPQDNDPLSIWYGIHEVFYDDQGEPAACTVESIRVMWGEGDSGEEVLSMMRQAFGRPILESFDFDPGGKYFGNSMWAKDDVEIAMENGTIDDLLTQRPDLLD